MKNKTNCTNVGDGLTYHIQPTVGKRKEKMIQPLRVAQNRELFGVLQIQFTVGTDRKGVTIFGDLKKGEPPKCI